MKLLLRETSDGKECDDRQICKTCLDDHRSSVVDPRLSVRLKIGTDQRIELGLKMH